MKSDQSYGSLESRVEFPNKGFEESIDSKKPKAETRNNDPSWDSPNQLDTSQMMKKRGALFFNVSKLLIMILRRQKITRRITLQRLFAYDLNKFNAAKQMPEKKKQAEESKLNFLLNKISVYSDMAQIHGYLIKKNDWEDPYSLFLIEALSLDSIWQESRILDNIIIRFLFLQKKLIAWLIEKLFRFRFYDKTLLALKFLYAYIIVTEQNKRSWDIFLDFCLTLLILDKIFRVYHFGIYFPANKAYFRSTWNTISLLIILTSFICRVLANKKTYDLTPLTLFDAFSLSESKTLYSLLYRIEKAVALLIETFVLVLSILIFFAIVGLQTFNQLLSNHCFDPKNGKEGPVSIYCGNVDCPPGLICGAITAAADSTNFDKFWNSLLQVIRVVTLERWTYLMNDIQRTYTSYSWIYFFSLVILGNFFLMNLILVVLRLKFLEQSEVIPAKNSALMTSDSYNLKELKKRGIYTRDFAALSSSDQVFEREKNLKSIHKVFKDVTSITTLLFSRNGIFSQGAKSIGELFNRRIKYKIVRQPEKENKKTTPKRSEKKRRSFSLEMRQILKMRFLLGLYNCLFSYIKIVFGVLKHYLSLNPFRSRSQAETARLINPFCLRVRVKREAEYFTLSREDVLVESESMTRAQEQKKRVTKIDFSYEMEGIYKTKLRPYFKDVNLDFISSIGRKNIWNIDLGGVLNQKNTLSRQIRLPSLRKRLERGIQPKSEKRRGIVSQKSLQNFMAENSTVFINALAKNRGAASAIPREIERSSSKKLNNRKSTLILGRPKGEAIIKINKIGNYEEKHKKVFLEDLKNGSMVRRIWSGSDVIANHSLSKMKSILHSMSKTAWRKFIKLRFIRLRLLLKGYFKNSMVEKVVVLLLLLNIIFYPVEDDLVQLDFSDLRSNLLIVLYVYLNLECFLKLLTFSAGKYLKNFTNVIDLLVTFSMDIDILLLHAYKEIQDNWIFRVFHALQVLRIFRILMIFRFTKMVTMVLRRNFFSFAWLGLLISTLMLSLGIIGMNFFTKKFKIELSLNFTNLQSAFMTTFQIMNLDNWYSIYEKNYQKEEVFTIFFIFLIIVVGNFIFLNIFLAIILSGFEDAFSQDLDDILEREGIETADTVLTMNYHIRKSLKASNLRDLPGFSEKKEKINRTLILFTQFNPIRQMSTSLAKSPVFTKIMFLVTFLSITNLGLETFVPDSDASTKDQLRLASKILLFSTNAMFTLESLAKIVSQGLVMGKGAYLKNLFNITEFICLLGFYINLLLTQLDMNNDFFRLIDLLRIIGPIKIIYLNPHTKIILLSLINSLTQLIQIFLVVCIVWLIFAFLGLILYRNRFGFCETVNNFRVGRAECEQRQMTWKTYVNNFDDLREAFATLFVISTLDDWSEIMYISSISNNDKEGPVEGNNHTTPMVYFLSFIMIGNYLFIGLFIGVMFSNFSKLRKKVQYKNLTNDQIQWIQLLPQILSLGPVKNFTPKTNIRRKLLAFLRSRLFSLVTRTVLLLDLLHQAVLVRDSSQRSLSSLFANIIYYISFVFYFLEFLFKIVAFGSLRFFSKADYRFEFVVVVAWTFYFILDVGDLALHFGWEFLQRGRITRALKLLKSFSLLRFLALFEPIRNFFINVSASMKLMTNMTLLLFVIFFIYGIVGCKLFGDIQNGFVIDDFNNFRNIFYAMMTLFRFSTADEWRLVLQDTYQLSGPLKGSSWGREISGTYFYSFILMTNFIFMNLFVLIIFDQFEQFFRSNLNPVTFFTLGKKFQSHWAAHSGKDRKFETIHVSNLIGFLKDIGPPLGFDKKESFFSIGMSLLNLEIRHDFEGYIHFNELFYVLLKHQFQDYLAGSGKKAAEKLLKEKEYQFYSELDKRLSTYQRKVTHRRFEKRKSVFGFRRDRNPLNLKKANPLSIIIEKLIVFRTWKRFSIMERAPQSRRVALKNNNLKSFPSPKEKKKVPELKITEDPPSSSKKHKEKVTDYDFKTRMIELTENIPTLIPIAGDEGDDCNCNKPDQEPEQIQSNLPNFIVEDL